MSQDDSPVRRRIFASTVRLLGREGIQALTVRSIAREAGVNIAAVNYYFGSKDALVEEVLRTTLDEMAGLPGDLLDEENLEISARMQAFFQGLMGAVLKYPGLVRAHLYAPLMQGDFDGPFVRRFRGFLEDIETQLKQKRVKVEHAEPRTAIVQMVSAVLLPALLPKMFEPFTGAKFSDPNVLRDYVASLLDCYLG
jgi:AcrR family transcriptional regulator